MVSVFALLDSILHPEVAARHAIHLALNALGPLRVNVQLVPAG